MKIGINAWCFPPEISTAKAIRLAAAAGLDAIELNMNSKESVTAQPADECPVLTPETTGEELAAIARFARSAGIELSGVSTGLLWSYPLTSPDAAVREAGERVVRRMIAAAKTFGADAVLVVPGLVTEEVSYRKAYERATESLRRLAVEAELEKVYLCVENVWNKFLLSPFEMRDFIDGIGSEYVQAYFDVGNVLQFSYPEYWIEILGKRIRRVHVKDFSCEVGNIHGFVNLLEGDVNWEKVVRALKGVGYDGPLTAELAPYRYYPEKIAADVADRLSRVLGRPCAEQHR